MRMDVKAGHKATVWENRSVRSGEIIVDDHFRARQGELSRAHVRVLASALTGSGTLDPLRVWKDPSRTDGALVLLDGAHRLGAYKAAKWNGDIPVRLALCDRRTALLIAAGANSKDKLSLHYSEKADMAWRLVREDEARYSKAEIAAATTVSRRTVANMRSRLRQMKEEGREPTGSWRRDRLDLATDWTPEGELEGAARDRAVLAGAKAILEAVGRTARHDERLVADMLEAAFGRHLRDMADYLYGDVDEWAGYEVRTHAGHMTDSDDEDTDF
ncbi:hypothetical protein EJC49_04650 [Aquibium carbonis]|uniref:Uncharacterized protein n=1 Tax=Aquibium carbonis TaxID=2495581 RepID=A0A429Z1F5_9HYPH|nr:ParB N-terminal domain-containing protein [Aquibium carbonis]RST87517.1 hypothetical protein EJC49_04650 [Aquibium carbonis]